MNTVKHILVLTLVHFCLIVHGQEGNVGIINDPDGFVNVRFDKSNTSEIIGKIEEGQKFYFHPKHDEQWWKVESYHGTTNGYMHRSRISNYHVDGYSCQCNKINGKSNPDFSFKLAGVEGSVCGYLLQRQSENRIKIAEFSIMECLTNEELIFYGALQHCYVEKVNNRLRIEELKRLPFGNNFERVEVPLKVRFVVLDNNNSLKLTTEIPVLNFKMSNSEIDRFIKNVGSLKGKGYFEGIETTIGGLLKCALNGSTKAKEILYDIENFLDFRADGAVLEFYNDVIDIHKWIKK